MLGYGNPSAIWGVVKEGWGDKVVSWKGGEWQGWINDQRELTISYVERHQTRNTTKAGGRTTMNWRLWPSAILGGVKGGAQRERNKHKGSHEHSKVIMGLRGKKWFLGLGDQSGKRKRSQKIRGHSDPLVTSFEVIREIMRVKG